MRSTAAGNRQPASGGLASRRADGAAGPWARRLGPAAAVASGLLLAASFPDVDAWPLAFVALVPLVLAAETRRPLRAFGLGWVTGFVFIGIVARWIAQIGDERTAGLLAWLALSAACAVYVGLFAALVAASARLPVGGGRRGVALRVARVALLAAAWAALEIARAHVPLGGFAWGLLGLTQHDGGPLLPLARVVGVYGLSTLIAAVNLAIAAALGEVLTARAGAARPARLAGAWLAVAVLLPFAGVLAPAPPPETGTTKRLVIVQGNVPFDRDNRGRTNAKVFADHVRLTEALAAGPAPDLVIWGEGAADLDPLAHRAQFEAVGRATSAARAPLLLGATTELGDGRYRTEGLLFAPNGALADRYGKRRLVPFGEYVPASGLMRRLVPATGQLPYDKVPGTALEPMLLGGTPFGTLICYENAYPEDVGTLADKGAEFVVLLANNASFGTGPIGRQHLAASQVRAVEQGRTVVHAAISGISAVIGPDGRPTVVTGLYEQAVVEAVVPARAGLTPYARFGRSVEAILVGATAALCFLLAALRVRARPVTAAVVERTAH